MTSHEEFEQSEKIVKEYTHVVYKDRKNAQYEFLVILWYIKLNIAHYSIIEVGEIKHYYLVNYKCLPADNRKIEAIHKCFGGYMKALIAVLVVDEEKWLASVFEKLNDFINEDGEK